MKNAILYTLLFALGLCPQIGCDLPSSPQTLSDVYVRFDPQQLLLDRGCDVEQFVGPSRLSPTEVFGWKPIQGSVVLPQNSSGCKLVAHAVRDALRQVVEGPCRLEMPESTDRRQGEPFYGMLRYHKDGMRGFVYLWLFPNETETQINYAILLHEEKQENLAASI